MLRHLQAQLILIKEALLPAAAAWVVLVAWLDYGRGLLQLPSLPASLQLGLLGERYLPLLVSVLAVPLWTELEGERPGLIYALPFDRLKLLLARLIIPSLLYLLLFMGSLTYYAAAGKLPLDFQQTGFLVELGRGLPAVVLLLALATCAALTTRMPLLGGGAVLLYWFAEYYTGGSFSGRWRLLTLGAELARQEYTANRIALTAAALMLIVLTYLWLRNNRRMVR